MSEENLDEILTKIGFGKWNVLYLVAYGLCLYVVPCFVLASAFIAPSVQFECDMNTGHQHNLTVDPCVMVTFTNSSDGVIQEEEQCSEFKYTDEVFNDTLTSEFNLVCEKSYLRPTYQIVLTIGSAIGSPLNGFLCDRLGRKKLMAIAAFISLVSIFASTFTSNFTLMLIFRFFTGLTTCPAIQTGFTLCLEVCEPKLRSTIGVIIGLPWAFGTVWWGVLGYLIKDWRWLMRATTIPACVYMILFCVMDESPRWSIVTGHHPKALKALHRAAKWNHATLPPDEELLKTMVLIQKFSRNKAESQVEGRKSSGIIIRLLKIKDQILILYRTPELRKRTLLLYIVFLVSGAVFYGLTLSAVNLKLDPFMYMIVGGLMEIPAYSLPAPIMIKTGRVKFIVASYFISGVTILILVFIPSEFSDPKWLIIMLAMIGKLCISAAYQVIYVIAAEVFPTEVRMQGIGTSVLASNVGAVSAPYITELIGTQIPWIPSLVFGLLSLLAALASVFIPETSDKILPETVLQLELESRNKIKDRVNEAEEQRALKE